jgi:hypothetical protein
MKVLATILYGFLSIGLSLGQDVQSRDCGAAKVDFDRRIVLGGDWTAIPQYLGAPSSNEPGLFGDSVQTYVFRDCSLEFRVFSGKVTAKNFLWKTAPRKTPAAASPNSTSLNVEGEIARLQATADRLLAELGELQRQITLLRQGGLQASTQSFSNSQLNINPSENPSPTALSAPCAENGSCFGDLSTVTGQPKTVHVQGYTRKDGTYVRGHYRSAPRR